MIRIFIKNYYYQKTLLTKTVAIRIVRENVYIKTFTMDVTIEIIITVFINTWVIF